MPMAEYIALEEVAREPQPVAPCLRTRRFLTRRFLTGCFLTGCFLTGYLWTTQKSRQRQ